MNGSDEPKTTKARDKKEPSWKSLDKVSKQLVAARELYVSSNISFRKLYALFDGVSRNHLTEVAKRENWDLQRTIYQTGNTELLQTLAQSQLNLLVIELNLANAYAQRLLAAMRNENLSLSALKAIKIDCDAAISRARYLTTRISAIPIIRVSLKGNVEAVIANEKGGKMETVQRWLRMPPALAESIAKLGVTGKQVGDFYVESLGNLGALNKLPKGLSRDTGTEDDTASSEPSPSRASNRVYKPMRRN